MIEAVLDANVFVSASIRSKNCREIIDFLFADRFNIVTSERLLGEIAFILSKNKFNLAPADVKSLVKFLSNYARFVTPVTIISDCRDPKDNALLECALTAKADCIVTGDNDLLCLNPYHGIRILPPDAFIRLLK